MQDIYITGGAMTRFGRHPGVKAPELAQQAVLKALADAGVALGEVQAVYCANVLGGMILGQLAWFVRDKLANLDPRRVPAAVDALFRTDLDMKSSGGDPRILLERLVVELSAGVGTADASGGGWPRR